MKIKLDKNTLFPMLFFIGTLVYLEITNHLFIYKSIDGKIIYPILFAVPMGIFFTILSGFLNHYGNRIIMWILTSLLCLIYGLQLVYFGVFKVYFSFQTLGMVNDAISEFGEDVNNAIKSNIIPILFVLLPLIALSLLLKRVLLCEKRRPRFQGYLLIGALCSHLLALLFLPLYGKTDYTPYDLYYQSRVPELSGKQLGVITLTRHDLSGLLRENDEVILVDNDIISLEDEQDANPSSTPPQKPQPSVEPEPTKQVTPEEEPSKIPTILPTPIPTPITDTSPNIMDIDFTELAENEDNQARKTLHNYFASVAPTNKNEFTGMFRGYNLILITAEGFSPYAVHKDVTPTLYKLTNEGFVFNNFYTALWQTSTSDGEYVALTGLIPVGTRSMYNSRNNLMPFTLGNQFNLQGIESKAYHNHSYTYYERNKTHPNLGYIFKGKGNGLVLDSDVWPGSDLEMIQHTVNEYIQEDPFNIYYMTVSGHMNYSFTGNSMSYKNMDLVKGLPYSSEVRAYIACQIELDKALEELINRLYEAGIAEKTVIALSSDHYPYGWEKDKIDEIAGHEVDSDFEVFRNHFILWNPGMETNVIIDEPASSMDILPTLCNLFGLSYDSRLMMGRDVFSDSEPLVILSNRSFVTDKVMYNSTTGEVIKLTDEELPTNYIKNINTVIKNKFAVSKSILKSDYYRYVFPYYPEEFLSDKKKEVDRQ